MFTEIKLKDSSNKKKSIQDVKKLDSILGGQHGLCYCGTTGSGQCGTNPDSSVTQANMDPV